LFCPEWTIFLGDFGWREAKHFVQLWLSDTIERIYNSFLEHIWTKDMSSGQKELSLDTLEESCLPKTTPQGTRSSFFLKCVTRPVFSQPFIAGVSRFRLQVKSAFLVKAGGFGFGGPPCTRARA